MNDKQAKYIEIENYIKNEIKTKHLGVDDKLPTEKELSVQFTTSILTVNKAMKNLENAGYLKRIQGKGSFVREQAKIQKHIGTFDSFTDSMKRQHKKAGSILIDYHIIKAKEIPEIAKKLNCEDNDFIHYFERIRTGDDEKVALSYTYLPYKVIAMVDIEILNQSLHNYLSSQGISMDHYDIEIISQMPDKQQKKRLEIGDVPLLVNKMTIYDQKNIPFEYVETFYIGSRFTYASSFYKK